MKSVLVFAFTAGFHEACCLKKNKKNGSSLCTQHGGWKHHSPVNSPSTDVSTRKIFANFLQKKKKIFINSRLNCYILFVFRLEMYSGSVYGGQVQSPTLTPTTPHPPPTPPRPSPLEVAPSILQNAVRFCIPASATAPSHLSTPSHAHTSLPLPLCLLCLSLPLATCALESPTNAGGARAPIRRLAPALRDTWPCRSVASAASAAAGQHCRTRPHSAMTHSRMSIFSFNFLVSDFECSSTIHAFPTSSLTLSLSFSPCLQCILGRIVEQAPG